MPHTLQSGKDHKEIGRALRETAGDAANWDVSQWTSRTVVGRVVPERCDVALGQPVGLAVAGGNGRALLRVHITKSHIAVKCVLENTDASIFQISDLVKNAIAALVDYISYMNRGYYDVVLDTCINDATGEAEAIPVFEPIFDPPPPTSLFVPTTAFEGAIPMLAAINPAFATALHDLSQASRYSPRTMEYCRMALEAIRHHFDPAGKHWRRRFAAGEEAMCATLKLSRKRLRMIEASAAPSRHGEQAYALNWAARKSVLEFGWEAVKRFELHLEGHSSNEWQIFG